MQFPDAGSNERSTEPEWFVLGVFSLTIYSADLNHRDTLFTGPLFDAVRGLDMSPEAVENIQRTLAEFFNQALLHCQPAGMAVSGQIRVFCQKMKGDAASITRAVIGADPSEKRMIQERIVHVPGRKMSEGWGFFLIERGGNPTPGSSLNQGISVDLYLYQEGK
jgi:hypothetical protein